MKKILLLLILCLGLIGCNKIDYGIFTEEAYNMFTEEERNEIQYRYDLLRKNIEMNDVPNKVEFAWIKDERDVKEWALITSNMSNKALKLGTNLMSMNNLLPKSLEGDEEVYSDYIWNLIETDDLLTKEAQDELLLKTVTLLDN